MRVCITCYAEVDKHSASLNGWGTRQWRFGIVTARFIYSEQTRPRNRRSGAHRAIVCKSGGSNQSTVDGLDYELPVRTHCADKKVITRTGVGKRSEESHMHEDKVKYAKSALLILEVYNHGQLSQTTNLGEATIPLSQIMDHRRHNKWLDLLLPEELHRVGLNNDAWA
ncbi:hypothetical protein PsorP6_009479 [Peronosclerospora sorghi]|uniref:Uncharacterized protein n=1 Tax=Peronosclerospora sorghi TaxID=230839 RepID=A0ACC0W2C8_9STRA|nr:hypothetical protein PsorP6_009479 [Peronosclerospora sorghi]